MWTPSAKQAGTGRPRSQSAPIGLSELIILAWSHSRGRAIKSQYQAPVHQLKRVRVGIERKLGRSCSRSSSIRRLSSQQFIRCSQQPEADDKLTHCSSTTLSSSFSSSPFTFLRNRHHHRPIQTQTRIQPGQYDTRCRPQPSSLCHCVNWLDATKNGSHSNEYRAGGVRSTGNP